MTNRADNFFAAGPQGGARRAAPPRLSNAGYTFAEMMVVVAIVALMMAIVIPRLAFQQRGVGLKGSASEIVSALRAARRLAIKDRTMYAIGFDPSTVPAQFVRLRYNGTTLPPSNWNAGIWDYDGELHRLHENIAIVAISTRGSTTLDARRTDDVDLDGDDDVAGAQELPSDSQVYNPELDPATGNPGLNGIVNSVLRLVKFQPTGTSDEAVIYLWNVNEKKVELPSASAAQVASRLDLIGVPPGLTLVGGGSQANYFTVQNASSTDDVYYYTVVVNPITGGVMIHDYAWGTGAVSGPNQEWDRRKHGG